MSGERLYNDADLAQFYDLDNGWADDTRFCLDLAMDAGSVLDLGCGTGLLAVEIATSGKRVVGADPAAAMLDVARGRPGGDRVRWVEADARAMRLGETFDLIMMTGHAFQVFLTSEDRLAVLSTIAAHLSPDGRFIVDSRNPAVEEWREWTQERSHRIVEHPSLGPVEAWNDVSRDEATGIVTYDTFYRATDDSRTFSATSKLGYPEKDEIERLIADAGLTVERWMGDWRGGALSGDTPEIIPLGRLA